MSALRFLFVLALLIVPFSVSAQDDSDNIQTASDSTKAKEKLNQQLNLIEQILVDAKSLKLPENRAVVFAKVGNALWQIDEKRARALFQSAIADLNVAQSEVESFKGNKHLFNNLIYGQTPRWEILNIIGNRDAEFALDAMLKTRPAKVTQAILSMTDDSQSQNSGVAKNEIQGEQRLIAMAADQNPQRAIKLLRESLKKDISYETINLLKKIFAKEPETANQLAEEVGQKILAAKLDEDNQDTNFIQYFLNEFGQEKSADEPTIKISDQLLKSLAEKLTKFVLRPNGNRYYGDSTTLKVIEKYAPASAAQIKQNQTKNGNSNEKYDSYNKLIQSDASSEELLSQAEKFPRSYRSEIYRRAAEKTASNGNIAEAQKIISANLTDEEAEVYLSQINYNLATQAISNQKFGDAEQLISQISIDNLRASSLIYLANAIYQKDPKENQRWASSVLNQARSLIADVPEKTSEMNALANLAHAYVPIEPAQAFRIIESLSTPLNEYSEAAAIVAKYSDYGNLRQGEYAINSQNNFLGVYNLTTVLQALKDKDFDRVIQFTNSFSRLDVRVSLKMQLLDQNFFYQELPMQGRRFSSVMTGFRFR